MAERSRREERIWEVGWDAHQRAQRRRMATLSLSEKLAWLESAQRLASHLLRPRQVARSEDDETT
jgi:hypothetical protein